MRWIRPRGRVHLLAPQRVRRAGGQAEAAMHAVAHRRRGGGMVAVEGADAALVPILHTRRLSSEAADEATRGQAAVGIEDVLDPPHQGERRHRPPHVERGLGLGRPAQQDGAPPGRWATARAVARRGATASGSVLPGSPT